MIGKALRGNFGTSDAVVYGNRFRQRRLTQFLQLVDGIVRERGRCRVLDLGGRVAYWTAFEELWRDRPVEFTIVNVTTEPAPDPRFVVRRGDACRMPEFTNNSFDIVHANSVIEHVGSWTNKQRMAAEVRRLAPHYFVQTPNFWFPFEPHFRMLFIHWLPRPMQRSLVMGGSRGFYQQAMSLDEADTILGDAALLDAREMAELFPDARIVRETVAGFVKSLIAVR